ncbi:rRNA maturation RNase YbeY [Nitzschia inconspicua]|uniref:rRNA maturation RNase YbeY n=1 Tax=Nitzschia inconspicua TaxID=303405 RepID=A0A9K3KM15_9STRA|nr:rRNA maturation RNase YbeY [Nitzschia inconspicua]
MVLMRQPHTWRWRFATTNSWPRVQPGLLSSSAFGTSSGRDVIAAPWRNNASHLPTLSPCHYHFPSVRLFPRSTSCTRLFGTKRGVPTNPPGTVAIYNDQTALPDIDEEALRQTIQRIAKLIGYETYDVTLLLVDDEEMRETNLETRNVDAPTDILSFPFHFARRPGLIEEPEFDIPDYYTLGDMMVCVPYVIRRCQEDAEDGDSSFDSDVEEDDEEEYDDAGVDGEDDDRGVSGAMATIKNPETRIRMLLVHGMLHLVGYDHENDDEYLEMVQREEEILKELGDL